MAKKLTLVEQYQKANATHPDMMLLFRMGDFYELFEAVARTIARLEGSDTVQGAHACEAIGYRRPKA